MFSQRLKDARKAVKHTQAEVAELVYITQQAYARYEIGAATPNPETLAAIAKVLNVTTDFLCGNADYIKLAPINDKELSLILFDTADGITPEMLSKVKDYAHALVKEEV